MEHGRPEVLDHRRAFEIVREQVAFIEDRIFLSDDVMTPEYAREIMQSVTAHQPYKGLPVSVEGGSIVTTGVLSDSEDDLDPTVMLVQNKNTVQGIYVGMYIMTISDPDFGDYSRIFHVIETEQLQTYDPVGNLDLKVFRTHVTARDSDVKVEGYLQSHSYETLRNDSLALMIDELAMDDSKNNDEKLVFLGKMFRRDANKYNLQKKAVDAQRLSYINHIGLFNGGFFAVKRMIVPEDNHSPAQLHVVPDDDGCFLIRYSSLEQCHDVMFEGNQFKQNSEIVLAIRGQHDEVGEVLVPMHHGLVFVDGWLDA